MCTIRDFTILLFFFFASVTAHLTVTPSVSPRGAPHKAVNRLHESTYMVKYKEAIKCQKHFYPKAKDATVASFAQQHVCPFTLYFRKNKHRMLTAIFGRILQFEMSKCKSGE